MIAPLYGSALHVYAGQANGPASTPTTVAMPGSTFTGTGVTGVDVNGDGRLDVVAATTSGFQVFTQPVGGGLVAATAIAFADAQKVVSADLDGDGDHDLVLTGSSAGGSRIATNDGTGTFTLGAVVPTSTAIAVGDITRDGRPDIVDASHYYAQTADGTFAAPATLPAMGAQPWRTLAIADVTGDGFADVVRPSATDAGFVRVDSMKADQTFATSRTYPAATLPDVVTTGDVNSDGLIDVVVGNGRSRRASPSCSRRATGPSAHRPPFRAGASSSGTRRTV